MPQVLVFLVRESLLFSFLQLVVSFWSCICRPDAGAMLGLLVLTALNESLLYFSLVAAGATLLTLSIDWLWLRFQVRIRIASDASVE